MKRLFIIMPLILAAMIIALSVSASGDYRTYRGNYSHVIPVPSDSVTSPGPKLNATSGKFGIGITEGYSTLVFHAIAGVVDSDGVKGIGSTEDTVYIKTYTTDALGFTKLLDSVECDDLPCTSTVKQVSAGDTALYEKIYFQTVYKDSVDDTTRLGFNIVMPIKWRAYLK